MSPADPRPISPEAPTPTTGAHAMPDLTEFVRAVAETLGLTGDDLNDAVQHPEEKLLPTIRTLAADLGKARANAAFAADHAMGNA